MSEKKGYRCLVPDLYKGKIGVDAEEASHMMGNLDFKNAVQELKLAVEHLKKEGSPKVPALACIKYLVLCRPWYM